MVRNFHENIKDIVLRLKFITPEGVNSNLDERLRIHNVPDLDSMVKGQEENFGLVLIPDYELDIKLIKEVKKSSIWVAPIRLMDKT
jgi:hypothetical protein